VIPTAERDEHSTEHEDAPCLRYEHESGAHCTLALEGRSAVTIGRGADADVRLSWDPSVSLLHAQAVRLGGLWLILDEGLSRNGTFINGERLRGRRRLRDGDTIRAGATLISFHDRRPGGLGATTVSDPRVASGTATLLFTDLVGSTELLDRLGQHSGERLRREHVAILRAATRAHGGREVKNLGDGLMLAFASALGAVACAIEMQQRVAAHRDASGGNPMRLRIGLNAGEVITAEDDYFGAPVVVARRLCDSAQPGQILTSEVVRSLAGDRHAHRFRALGERNLKGMSRPIATFALDWR
jgi:class 3 adenylate cyclase